MTLFKNYLENEIEDLALAGTVIASYSAENFVSSNLNTLVPFDGIGHSFDLISNDITSWFDGNSGSIILPGLYVSGIGIDWATPPTTPGLFGRASTFFNVAQTFAVDGIALGTHNIIDIQSLGVNDLPYPLGTNVSVQTDVTGILSVTLYAVRLVYS